MTDIDKINEATLENQKKTFKLLLQIKKGHLS